MIMRMIWLLVFVFVVTFIIGCRTTQEVFGCNGDSSIATRSKFQGGEPLNLAALAQKYQCLICGHERLTFALELCDHGMITAGTPSSLIKEIFGRSYLESSVGGERGYVNLANDLPSPPDEYTSQAFVGWDLTIHYDKNKRISGYFFTNLQKEPTPDLHKCWEQELARAETLLPLVSPLGVAVVEGSDRLKQTAEKGVTWTRLASEFAALRTGDERKAFTLLLFDSQVLRWGIPICTVKAIFRDAYFDRGPFGNGYNSGLVYLAGTSATRLNKDAPTLRSHWRVTFFYDEDEKITGYYLTNLWRNPE